MPHFIIDCSESILKLQAPEALMQVVYETAEASVFYEGHTSKGEGLMV